MPNPADRPTTVVACPECESRIPARAVLFDFQFRSGDQDVLRYAECPHCDAVVHPVVRRRDSP